MSFPLSRRIADLQSSDIRLMTRACERVGGINLGQGLGDLPTPPSVREGAITAIQTNRNRYSLPEGIGELRRAIAAKLIRDNALDADPEREIVVTPGATGAFAAALTALFDPGDGIVLPEPYYGYHLNTIRLCDLDPHFLTLQGPGFELEEAALRSALRPNTRAILLCTPSNPSGKMLSEEEIRRVERVAADHDLLVITDEIYEYLTYDGRQHRSPAAVGGLRERTVSIFGFSKTFSITGWRLGYVVAPEPLAAAINLVNDLLYVCAPTPLQYGVLEGLRAAPDYFTHLRATYQRKRDLLCEGLAAAGLEPLIPNGAYYVLADIGRFGYPNAKAGALALLEQTGVAGVPGSAFYRSGEGERLIRFCFAKEDAVLREAVARLRRFRPAG
ncbi:pyridoxal phosphate-dependent aminotransferase [Candidatus Methylocalor cossyra]|uniref:Aminotransferase n=1 Tax=Candidatus Methylocalor cossyra TaxID=3108543 RepID=A0ABM9NE97_9GAMM